MIYDYICPKGHIEEHFSSFDDRMKRRRCSCGKLAWFTMPAPRIDYYHMGVDPTFGTAADKWADMHTQKLRVERKQELYE